MQNAEIVQGAKFKSGKRREKQKAETKDYKTTDYGTITDKAEIGKAAR